MACIFVTQVQGEQDVMVPDPSDDVETSNVSNNSDSLAMVRIFKAYGFQCFVETLVSAYYIAIATLIKRVIHVVCLFWVFSF